MDVKTPKIPTCSSGCACESCTGLRNQISEIRRHLDAFQILSEKNPHVSSSILIQNIRSIIDSEEEEEQKNNPKGIEYKSQNPERVQPQDNSSVSTKHDKIKSRINMEPHGHIETNWTQVVESFDEMNLDPALLRGIYAYGFECPSAVQKRAILPAIRGWDVIAQAPTETGRTAAIVIAVLQRIQRDNPHCQALFLTLTADAALKIRILVLGLGAYLGISCHTCHLGHNDDLLKMKQGRQIVIGTPTDARRMLINQTVTSQDIRILVIDDADKLLSGELKQDTLGVMKALDLETQIVMMSVTMSHDVIEGSKQFMRHPVTISVQDEAKHQRQLRGVKEFFMDVDAEELKLPKLCNLFDKLPMKQAIVFCNTVSKVEWLTRRMREKNLYVSAVHGNLEDEDRELMLKEFGSGTLPILISTTEVDLQHGLRKDYEDGEEIPIVINYDFPVNPKNYIQRIWFGRRFGGGGIAISFITSEDKRSFQTIQIVLGNRIEALPEDLSSFLKRI